MKNGDSVEFLSITINFSPLYLYNLLISWDFSGAATNRTPQHPYNPQKHQLPLGPECWPNVWHYECGLVWKVWLLCKLIKSRQVKIDGFAQKGSNSATKVLNPLTRVPKRVKPFTMCKRGLRGPLWPLFALYVHFFPFSLSHTSDP